MYANFWLIKNESVGFGNFIFRPFLLNISLNLQ